MSPGRDEHPTDVELRARTAALVEAAERVARELQAQNHALAEAIREFERDVLMPLRREHTS